MSEPTGNHVVTSRNFSLDIGGQCQLLVTAQFSIVEKLGSLLTVFADVCLDKGK